MKFNPPKIIFYLKNKKEISPPPKNFLLKNFLTPLHNKKLQPKQKISPPPKKILPKTNFKPPHKN